MKRDADIHELAQRAKQYHSRLSAIKRATPLQNCDWYPYDSLSAFAHFDAVLTGRSRRLLELIGDDPVADIGCADGDISFFLESLGSKVHAIDHPVPNHNGMTGVKTLKALLHSAVEIHAIDLDDRFELPARAYGMVLSLGILYHLKNPFYALEKLSKAARCCLFSTRIADCFPGIAAPIAGAPVAYLLDEDELNWDNSNCWIPSDAGLRRLLKRTNWEVVDYFIQTGDELAPRSPFPRDVRAFGLARSCFALKRFELLHGWHAPEGNGWRWTEKRFGLEARLEGAAGASAVRVKLFVPAFLLERWTRITLSAAANGVALPPEVYSTPGDALYERRLPTPAALRDPLRLEFWVDSALPPEPSDQRERGVIVTSIELV